MPRIEFQPGRLRPKDNKPAIPIEKPIRRERPEIEDPTPERRRTPASPIAPSQPTKPLREPIPAR